MVSMSMMEPDDNKLRIDKWLWAARFYKTRSLATEAVSGGKVHVNGQRVKPAYKIKIGDELGVKRGITESIVVVRGLCEKRRPASEAQLLYEETASSIELRNQQAEQRKLIQASAPSSKRRPNKQQRRHIIRFTRK
jgi:ribosome-associated heat shock protein Hsp15